MTCNNRPPSPPERECKQQIESRVCVKELNLCKKKPKTPPMQFIVQFHGLLNTENCLLDDLS